jgi:biotin carboxylase
MERILCISGSACGQEFLRQCAALGVRPTLLTLDGLRDADWPREAIEDLATMPEGLNCEQVLNTVSWMARGRLFNRVAALDEGSLLRAAEIREHMRIPGMGITTAGYYRDRLAMRVSARESGFAVPEFCRVLNYDELRAFMERVPAPWMLRPRRKSAGLDSRRVENPEELWRALEQLGDRQSRYLLEQLIQGELFTVESVVSECRVVFSVVHRHRGWPEAGAATGASLIETVDRTSRDWMELTALNGGLAPSLGMVRGLTHARFLRGEADGRHYFLEIAAGVGEGGLGRLVEAGSGLNLWQEWARLEAAHLRGEGYLPCEWFESYAASLEWPAGGLPEDAAELSAPEIAERLRAQGRESVLVRSSKLERVAQLLDGLVRQIAARGSGLPAAEPGGRPGC